MSLRIHLDTSDYDVKMSILRNRIPNFTPRLILNGTTEIKDILQSVVPVRTGFLRDTIETEIQDEFGRVSTTSGYGKFVDEDTREHEIVARIGKALRFEINGEEFFRKRVVIPARKGVQFRRATLDIFRDRFLEIVKRTYDEVFR